MEYIIELRNSIKFLIYINILNIQFKGRAISEILNSKMYLQKTYFNPYEYYSVDKVMYGYGLNINRKYRGKGIATQLLKGR